MPKINRPSYRRALLAVLAAVALVPAIGAAPARHLRLERSAPADSSVVEPPAAVSLWFSQVTALNVTRVLVRSAAGDTIPTLGLTREAAAKSPVVAAFRAPLAAGAYTVDWRTMAADGHVVRGTFGFTVKARAAGP
jgi:methionine-rich copper-binding protein CopC